MSELNRKIEKKLLSPFPGLRPFGIEESQLFFGREGQSEEVLNNLAKNKFVAVVGSSGSGKSSLMYCGLVPVLHGGFITEAGSKWRVIVSRPDNDPIGNLAKAIVADKKNASEIEKTIVRSTLESSSLGLVEAIDQLDRDEDENILILADQFEELFRFKKNIDNENSTNESYAYVKLLLEAVKQSKVPIYVIMTMRSDFIGECAQYQELTKFINDSHYLIPQMTRDNLRSAIEGPVAVGGGVISEKLVNQLLNDVGDNPDQLPILQHALMRTWNYWVEHNKTDEEIDIIHYDAIGRMDKALSNHANEAFDELTPNEKRICENIFKTLTERGNDNRGIRHPSSVLDIAAISKSKEDSVIKVIEQFRLVGRSFLTSSDTVLSSASIVDISHESLMRIWDKLKIWVNEEALAVHMYIRLSEAAGLYQEGKTGLWRPPDLHLALAWRKEKQPTLTWAKRFSPAFERTMVYLETSEKDYIAEEQNKLRLQKKAIRRSRIFAIVLGIAAIVSMLFMVYAFIQQGEASKQQLLAEEKTKEAIVLQKLAETQRKLADRKTKEADEQRKFATKKERQARQAQVEAEKQKINALRSLEMAKTQKRIAYQKSIEADEQRKFAETKTQEAFEQKSKAETATKDAKNLRMLSISQSMAVKSVQIEDDKDKKSLLAYQAYLFNKKYGGKEYNPDVYDGLYYSLKAKNNDDFTLYKGHSEAVRAVAYIPASDAIYSTGSDGSILKWSMSDESKKPEVIYSSSGVILRDIAISNNSEWLASGSDMAELLIVNLLTKDKQNIKIHNDVITSVIFTNDAKNIITASLDSTIISWNLNTQEKTIIGKCESPILSISITNNDKFVYCSTEGGELIRFNISNGEKTPIYKGENSINVVTLNKDGSLLAYGDKLGAVYVLETENLKLKAEIKAHKARVNDIKFSPDGKLLASASFDGTTKVWQTENYNYEPLVFKDHESWVMTLVFSEDSKVLITGCVDSNIKKWDINTETIAAKLKEKINRNMTEMEWDIYVGEDIPYEKSLDFNP